MDKEAKPFFINSRILFEKEQCLDFRNIFRVVGNSGNSYITYSLIKSIFGYVKKVPNIPFISNYDFSSQDKDIEYINAECSHVFLVLQDQIRDPQWTNDPLPYSSIEAFVSKLNKPIIVAGFGANNMDGFDSSLVKRLSPEMVHFLHFLSDHCVSIGVRGFFTEEIFRSLGIDNVQAIGCPSFYESGEDRIIHKARLCRQELINKSILTSMMDCYLNKNTPCILQDEYDIVSRIQQGDLGLRYYKNFFFSPFIDQWKKELKKYSFAYGTRMHGAIIAINSGLPAVVMNKDARAREMCELMHIPYLPHLRGQDVEDLYEHCDVEQMNKAYPQLYENYKNFMKTNGVELSKPVLTAANACPDWSLYPEKELNPLEKYLVEQLETLVEQTEICKKIWSI